MRPRKLSPGLGDDGIGRQPGAVGKVFTTSAAFRRTSVGFASSGRWRTGEAAQGYGARWPKGPDPLGSCRYSRGNIVYTPTFRDRSSSPWAPSGASNGDMRSCLQTKRTFRRRFARRSLRQDRVLCGASGPQANVFPFRHERVFAAACTKRPCAGCRESPARPSEVQPPGEAPLWVRQNGLASICRWQAGQSRFRLGVLSCRAHGRPVLAIIRGRAE